MIILITILLMFIFILNLVTYWLLYEKNKEKLSKKLFYKLFPVIWTLSIIPIPIINSGFLEFLFPTNYSYFQEYWIFFALLGILFIIIGIIFAKRAKKLFKINMVHGNSTNLIRSGVFKIVRHPTYFSWTIIIFGAALISDSLISLIIGVLIYTLFFLYYLQFKKYKKLRHRFGKPKWYNIILTLLYLVASFLLLLIF